MTTTPMTADEAQQCVESVRRLHDDLVVQVTTLYDGQGWLALGYDTWADLCAAEFPDISLPRAKRQEVVPELRAAGMSTRAIAAATGASQRTVVDDLAGEQKCSPAAPTPVTGLDGKTYAPKAKPAPVTPGMSASERLTHEILAHVGIVGRVSVEVAKVVPWVEGLKGASQTKARKRMLACLDAAEQEIIDTRAKLLGSKVGAP